MSAINILDEKHEKLFEAAINLDITVLDCQKLITIEEDAGVACWSYDYETKEEKIIIGPEGLELSTRHIEFVLRHELLHKCGYKVNPLISYDPMLMNIALDICVNRVLYEDYKNEFEEFCNEIYGKHPENRQNHLVLAWAGIDSSTIQDEKLRTLYHKIWKTKHIPYHWALYYTLLEHGVSGNKISELEGRNPFGFPARGSGRRTGSKKGGNTPKDGEGTTIYRRQIPSEGLEDITAKDRFEKKAMNTRGEKRAVGGFSNAISKWFETIEIKKKECATSDVDEFIQRIETTDTIDEVATRITSAIISDTRVQFYPYRLTRSGYVYFNTGISDLLHRYYNRTSDRRKPRLNIYVDTSPSMQSFKEKEVFLIERFKDLFPTTFYVFAGEVKEFLIDDFIKGKYPMGASTSFDSVIEHFVSSEAECAVIFTDGMSSVKRDNCNRVKEFRKRLFTVYFNGTYTRDINRNKKVQSDLDDISEDVMQIDVPLS